MYANWISSTDNFVDIFLFICFVDTDRVSPMPFSIDATIYSDYNKDDYMSMNYNKDNTKIIIDAHRLLSMESQMMSDLVCPTNSMSSKTKSKEYSSTQQTMRHQIIHNEEKLHKCSMCNKCFTQKASLNVHQRIHTGEKPYKCSTCNKCLTRKCLFKKHQRIHTGEKSYKWYTCDKCFTQQGHLKGHQRIHSGEKPSK